ncbi:MAG: type VI secretion protein, partial [Sphingomonadales bacterium]
MNETRETVEKLKLELQEVRAAAGAQGSEANALPKAAQSPTLDPKPVPPGRARGRAARAAAGRAGSDQLSFDLAGLGLKEVNTTQLAAAVQTTRTIIEAHG